MRVLCVTGPLGAGKTTTILRLAVESGVPDSARLIVNEVGDIQIDTERLGDVVDAEQVSTLVAGCLGCDSAAEFDELVAGLAGQGVDDIIVEPTGVADPREIKAVTDRHGLEWSCLTLVNARTLGLNQTEGMLAAQLSVATTVAISRAGYVDCQTELLGYIAQHAPGVPIHELSEGAALPFSFAELVANQLASAADGGHGHHTHHDHGHEHEHEHGHGYQTTAFAVSEELDVTRLEQLFANMAGVPERAKGVLAGRQFDWVGGEMSVGRASDETPHLVVIARQPFAPELLGDFALSNQTAGKKQLMRGNQASLQETLQAIEYHAARYPTPEDSGGLPVLGAESDIAWQMAKRTGVPEAYKRLTLEARMRFLLEGLRVLEAAELNGLYPTQLRLARDLMEAGAALAWNAQENRRYMAEETIALVAKAQASHQAVRGLAMLPTLRLDLMADNASGPTTPEAMAAILRFGFDQEGMHREDALVALSHATDLASNHPQWLQRWQNVIDNLELD